MFLTAIALAAQAAAGPVCDASWTDPARNRAVPVRIRMPAGTGKAPVILFSHGLGGSLDAGTVWGKAWAEAGFVVIHLQHPGSDTAAIRTGLRQAMSGEQLIARTGDVRFVIDMLAQRPREGGCDLGRADRKHIGMSGHSFGAHTAQAIAGQSFERGGKAPMEDPRVSAAIGFSPAPPARGRPSDTDAFGSIAIPFYSLTGTEDQVAITTITAQDRQRPFRAMPPGGKYLLVLKGANHAAFSGQDRGVSRGSTPDAHVRPIVIRSTTAFWRWTLKGDAAAKAELDRTAAALGPDDRFETR